MAFAIDWKRAGFAILAVSVAAALIFFGTGLRPYWPLMWLAPLPVLLLAARSSATAAAHAAVLASALGNLNMWRYYAALLRVPFAASMGLLLAPALMFALAVLLYRALLLRGKVWSALLAFPALWTSYEYLLNLLSPHATAGSLAYSQLNFLPVLQLASITGPWGIVFLLCAVPAALAIAIHLRAQAPSQALHIAAATIGVFALVLLSGAVRLALPLRPDGEVKVGLVASDFGANSGVAKPGPPTEQLLHAYADQAEMLIARGAQAVVLAEHVGEVVDPRVASADAIFQPIADTTGSIIVVGLGHRSEQGDFNQARVYQPHVSVQSYDKHHLLPPFESRFAPGRTLAVLPRPQGKWGIEICKDMDFTPLSRRYGQAGAGLMLVPAWDFQLDRVSHGHMAIMRGVEDGFAIARAARGGNLTVTDDRGRILAETQSNSAPFATLLATVPAAHDNTLYLRWGDWFARLALFLLALAIIQLILPARSSLRQSVHSCALPVAPSTPAA